MTDAFDNRLISLQITVDNETLTYDQSYAIVASGTKYTNGNFADFLIRIDNIAKTDRNFLTTKTSPWSPQRTNALVSLNVGRASYGTFQMATGNAIACNPTQPPDIGLILKSQAFAASMGFVGAFSAPPTASLKSICQQVATNLGIPLDYQATQNPTIGNYHFSGASLVQVKKLNELANINAYIDNSSNTLVVLDNGTGRINEPPIIVSSATGMVGVPEISEIGVRCKMLILNEIKVGSRIQIQSEINPAANGTYYIAKLGFEVASRDTPFYWLIDARVLLGSTL